MRLFNKIIASTLLLLNGSAAIYGGLNMIIYPDGSSIHLPMRLLRYSSIGDFFWPGIVLTVMIGMFNIYAMITVIISFRKYWLLVMMQGAILVLWLMMQLSLIHFIGVIHVIMIVLALLLIITGISMAPYQDELKRNKI